MDATARAEGQVRTGPVNGGLYAAARQTLWSVCPQALLNRREARFYERYGEVELHLLEFLCRRDQDAIDVGASEGCYVHFLRRHAKRVIAFEPVPALARALRRKFRRGIVVESVALSDKAGTLSLRMPAVDGGAGRRAIEAPRDRLDEVYGDEVGFIKIDVEGHEQAILDGAVETIRRCQPRLLVEIDERLSPGGLERARGYFEELGYRGYYVHAGCLEPIGRFSIEALQRPANLPDLAPRLKQHERFGRYVYNFIFLPPHEPSATLRLMTDRLSRL